MCIANVWETIFPLSTTKVSVPSGMSVPTRQVMKAMFRSTRREFSVKRSIAFTGRDAMKSAKKSLICCLPR